MKKLLVLDIDNTLLHALNLWEEDSFRTSKQEQSKLKSLNCPIGNMSYTLFFRPGLEKFLQWANENFRIGIWSAGTPIYVLSVVETLFINHLGIYPYFVFTLSDVQLSRQIFGKDKDLRLLPNYNPKDTLLIDDLLTNICHQAINTIPVPAFNVWNRQDRVLSVLAKYLDQLKLKEDIRGYHDLFDVIMCD